MSDWGNCKWFWQLACFSSCTDCMGSGVIVEGWKQFRESNLAMKQP